MSDQTFDRMADAVRYLSKDDGYVPCSRYGRNSEECAPYAFILSLIHATHGSGEPIDVESLDYSMGLVVNDHDDVAELITEHGGSLGWQNSNGWGLDSDGDLIPVIDNQWMFEAYRQYVDTLLWSDSWSPEDADSISIPCGDLYGYDDIPVDAHETLREEFKSFCIGSWDDLFDMSPEQVGHDFALTRNGHGAGFWDRGLGTQGDRLTKASKAFGSFWLGEVLPAPDADVLADALEDNR